MAKNEEKAIGLRVPIKQYNEMDELRKNLDGIPINKFALRCVESVMEMLTETPQDKMPTIPKWIAVSRYSLNYEKKTKKAGDT
jgi:hypothetical protein